jgi:hypothetical protein
MKALKFWLTIATNCLLFTRSMNGSYTVGHELASGFLFYFIVYTLYVLLIF